MCIDDLIEKYSAGGPRDHIHVLYEEVEYVESLHGLRIHTPSKQWSVTSYWREDWLRELRYAKPAEYKRANEVAARLKE